MHSDLERVRLAHFSDVHLTTRPLGFGLRDLATKRVTGWLNLRALGRGSHFRMSDEIIGALVNEFRQRRPDRLIFSGDATCLGFSVEFEHAARSLHVGDSSFPPGLAVPGNHDYYTKAAIRFGAFEREFAPWQEGERVSNEIYPFAQRVGSIWLIAVNSSTPNLRPLDASGAVGPAQLDRLRELLRQLPDGPRILVTHFPVCLADGSPETRWHGLRDLEATVRTAADGGVGLWLHGHRHKPYVVPNPPNAPFPVICSGSATDSRHKGYFEYEFTGTGFVATQRTFDPSSRAFRAAQRLELSLRQI